MRTLLFLALLTLTAFADDDLDRANAICAQHRQPSLPAGLGSRIPEGHVVAPPPSAGVWEAGWESCTAVLDRWNASEHGRAAAAKKAAEENDKAFVNGVAR